MKVLWVKLEDLHLIHLFSSLFFKYFYCSHVFLASLEWSVGVSDQFPTPEGISTSRLLLETVSSVQNSFLLFDLCKRCMYLN